MGQLVGWRLLKGLIIVSLYNVIREIYIMDSIRIKNLRSLRDTEEIPIKRINILVGNNSSGKSTFLRVFPLLKQSFNKKITGPILWCGDDDDYVDFGSFQEAVSYRSENKGISLGFDIQLDYSQDLYGYRRGHQGNKLHKSNIEFLIKNSANNGNDYILEVQYSLEEQRCSLMFSENGDIKKLSLNGKDINVNTDKQKEPFYPTFYDQNIFDISLYPLRKVAIQNLDGFFSMPEDGKIRYLEEVSLYIVNKEILHDKSGRKYNEKVIEKVNEVYNSANKQEVKQWAFLFTLPNYFAILSNYLKEYFRNVYYIAPVRATAERYYRLRNAAVNEVDCRGKNLPVFLNSLSSKSFSQFQEWTKAHLGFEVVKTTSEGHVSLKIKKEGQGKAVNLSDTGFGYSQILPIVTQIWYIAKQIEEEKELPFYVHDFDLPTTIVIEQPELHLHPALQAKLIDIIVKVAAQGNINFIIETHSETMVNRVGNSIAKSEISNEDVGVIIFEKNFGEDDTTIKKGGFDKEGYLENWPVGFFEPETE